MPCLFPKHSRRRCAWLAYPARWIWPHEAAVASAYVHIAHLAQNIRTSCSALESLKKNSRDTVCAALAIAFFPFPLFELCGKIIRYLDPYVILVKGIVVTQIYRCHKKTSHSFFGEKRMGGRWRAAMERRSGEVWKDRLKSRRQTIRACATAYPDKPCQRIDILFITERRLILATAFVS